MIVFNIFWIAFLFFKWKRAKAYVSPLTTNPKLHRATTNNIQISADLGSYHFKKLPFSQNETIYPGIDLN